MRIHAGIIGCNGIAAYHIRGYQQAGTPIAMVSDIQQEAAQRHGQEVSCEWSTAASSLDRRT